MGNLCMIDDYNKKRNYVCSKCKVSYSSSHGIYSERLSCRIHELDENNFCIGCRKYINKGNTNNCYHY